MQYAPKIVLHCPDGYQPQLDEMVETFLSDGVLFVGVIGKECSKVEDIIDELVVGNGHRDYGLLTSSHPGETIEEAIQFAKALVLELADLEVQVVKL